MVVSTVQRKWNRQSVGIGTERVDDNIKWIKNDKVFYSLSSQVNVIILKEEKRKGRRKDEEQSSCHATTKSISHRPTDRLTEYMHFEIERDSTIKKQRQAFMKVLKWILNVYNTLPKVEGRTKSKFKVSFWEFERVEVGLPKGSRWFLQSTSQTHTHNKSIDSDTRLGRSQTDSVDCQVAQEKMK